MRLISCDPGLDRVSFAGFSADPAPHWELAGPEEKLRCLNALPVFSIQTPPDLPLAERVWRIQRFTRSSLRGYNPDRFILELPRVSGAYRRNVEKAGETGGGMNDALAKLHIATGAILGAATAVLGGDVTHNGRIHLVKARNANKDLRLAELALLFRAIGRPIPTRNKDDLDAIDIGINAQWPFFNPGREVSLHA